MPLQSAIAVNFKVARNWYLHWIELILRETEIGQRNAKKEMMSDCHLETLK